MEKSVRTAEQTDIRHTVFMYFIFIWEQTSTFTTYIINWLVL